MDGVPGGRAEADIAIEPDAGLPPGPRTPATRQTLQWMFKPIELMERCRRKYGPLFSIRLGPAHHVVMVGEPQLAKAVLAGDPETLRAGDTNGLFRPVVGSNSILLLDGDAHLTQRRILLPSFSGGHAAQ